MSWQPEAYVYNIFERFDTNSFRTIKGDQEYAPPPKYPPITAESISNEIGLIQVFLKKNLEEFGLDELLEDEDIRPRSKPPRPRLPPNGKITTGRKRIASSVFLNQSLRKKRCLKENEQGTEVTALPEE